ncbi:hypothetical protein YTPLAS72_35800 [Nitrospira sp.]|nr:hypothetical protein YTPLAS72_35800 [Nitrospira sp.]
MPFTLIREFRLLGPTDQLREVCVAIYGLRTGERGDNQPHEK